MRGILKITQQERSHKTSQCLKFLKYVTILGDVETPLTNDSSTRHPSNMIIQYSLSKERTTT